MDHLFWVAVEVYVRFCWEVKLHKIETDWRRDWNYNVLQLRPLYNLEDAIEVKSKDSDSWNQRIYTREDKDGKTLCVRKSGEQRFLDWYTFEVEHWHAQSPKLLKSQN